MVCDKAAQQKLKFPHWRQARICWSNLFVPLICLWSSTQKSQMQNSPFTGSEGKNTWMKKHNTVSEPAESQGSLAEGGTQWEKCSQGRRDTATEEGTRTEGEGLEEAWTWCGLSLCSPFPRSKHFHLPLHFLLSTHPSKSITIFPQNQAKLASTCKYLGDGCQYLRRTKNQASRGLQPTTMDRTPVVGVPAAHSEPTCPLSPVPRIPAGYITWLSNHRCRRKQQIRSEERGWPQATGTKWEPTAEDTSHSWRAWEKWTHPEVCGYDRGEAAGGPMWWQVGTGLPEVGVGGTTISPKGQQAPGSTKNGHTQGFL